MNTVLVGDCLELFPRVRTQSVDLIVADPPFNIGYGYDKHEDSMTPERYAEFTEMWLYECRRVLADHGSIYVCIGDEYAAQVKLAMDALFRFRNWIIWHYTFGVHNTQKFGRDHTHILYYTKSKTNFTFNSDKIRIESERQRLGDPRACPHGRVPGDVWTIPRLVGNARERTPHVCQMPEAVIDRIVRASSDPGDMVLDPFAGSGTTLAVAKKLGRNFLGFELSENYAGIALARLAAIEGEGCQKKQ